MFNEILSNGFKKLNLEYTKDIENKFFKYKDLLVEWNLKMNLTNITESDEVARKHFLDSLTLVLFHEFKNTKKIIDIGSGAGFPGIPIAICFPEIEILLVDSLNKRITFLDEVIKELGLTNIKAIHGRAEELVQNKNYRESFDVVTSRAVANLQILSELSIPFVKLNGYFIPMKGSSILSELENSQKCIQIVGGKLESVIDCNIFEDEINHNIALIRKVKQTIKKYPRKYSSIVKSPL